MKICPEFAPFAHWTELDDKKPAAHDCTRCWYGCRGENEAPVTLRRVVGDLGVGAAIVDAARGVVGRSSVRPGVLPEGDR